MPRPSTISKLAIALGVEETELLLYIYDKNKKMAWVLQH